MFLVNYKKPSGFNGDFDYMARGGFYNDMIHRQEKFGAKNFVHIAWFI